MAARRATKTVPQFKSLDEESDFWDAHSVTEFEAMEVTAEDLLGHSDRRSRKQRLTLSLDRDLVARLKAVGAERHLPVSAVAGELLRQGIK